MAYEKQNFEDGTTLFASQLNHIEDGIIYLENAVMGDLSNDTYVGTTPIKLTKSGTFRLVCESSCTYSIVSDTVAMADIMGGTVTSATITKGDGYYQLQTGSGVTAWYQSYITIPIVAGLTIGEKYNFIFDASGMPFDEPNNIHCGHWILKDENGSTLLTRVATNGGVLHAHEFIATTKDLSLIWYPLPGNAYSSGEIGTANVKAIYINRAGTTSLSDVMYRSGTFTGMTTLRAIPTGATITADPQCEVYLLQVSKTKETRHSGKVCVCFGDSVTGNMTAPDDYPSVVAAETGMTAVNAGFGGCRMSDTHPTTAYAAFSMVKLADAVASGNWAFQNDNVSGLSTVTNGVEHLAALKAVNWSEVDFITIAYGTNDIQGSVAIDNTENSQDTKTYLGALRYAITKILTAYPHIKILLLTPIYRYWNDENIDSDSKMFNSHKFTEWGDGLLGVAEHYKIPAVDMYRTLGFNAITRSYYFPSTDGTHPNAEGLRLIGSKIAARLLAEY